MFISHRGFNKVENTLESILEAIKYKVDGIEFDIQTCLTGELVLFHDEDLSRLCKRKEKISELSYLEISKIRLKDTEYRIPKLIDVLNNHEIINSNILINIELKDKCESLLDILEDLIEKKIYNYDRFLISSYSEDIFNFKNFKIGKIFDKDNLDLNTDYLRKFDYIIIDKNTINKTIITYLKVHNLKVFLYTVDEYKYFHKNIDGYITDNPYLKIKLFFFKYIHLFI